MPLSCPTFFSVCSRLLLSLCRQDVAFWSAAAFALRVRALISAAGTLLPREMGFG